MGDFLESNYITFAPMPNEELQELANLAVDVHRARYPPIHIQNGQVRRVIFMNNPDSLSEIKDYIGNLYIEYQNSFRINIIFGYVMLSGRGVYLTRPYENDDFSIFRRPRFVYNHNAILDILEYLNIGNITDHAPNHESFRFVSGVYCVKIIVTRTEFIMGNPNAVIHEHVTKSQSIMSLNDIDDKLCIFTCLVYKASQFKGICQQCSDNFPLCKHFKKYIGNVCIVCLLRYTCDKCEEKPCVKIPTKTLRSLTRIFFNISWGLDESDCTTYKKYLGFNINDRNLVKNLEDFFKVYLNIFIVEGTKEVNGVNRLILSWLKNKKSDSYNVPGYKEMNLLAYNDHLSYITNKELVLCLYKCNVCSKLFNTHETLTVHQRKCKDKVRENFPKVSRQYEPAKNFIIKLMEIYDIKEDVDIFYDYFITYDYEVILKKLEEQKISNNTSYTVEHYPVSVAASTNYPLEDNSEYNKTISLVCDDFEKNNPGSMTKELFKYFKYVGDKIYDYMKNKYKVLFNSISERINESKSNSSKEYHQRNFDKLDKYCRQTPIFGFNSGKYDINVNKSYGFFQSCIDDKIDGVVKKGSSYLSIKTSSFIFNDIHNYIPPNYSLDQFVKAYTGKEVKHIFPYEWFDSLDKLYFTEFPPIEAFSSKLKGTKCNENIYSHYKKGFDFLREKGDIINMKDYLKFYNECDVEPFVEAIDKYREYYKNFDIDMIKDCFTISSLANKMIFHFAKNTFRDYLCDNTSIPENIYNENNIDHDELYKVINHKIISYKNQDQKADRMKYVTENNYIYDNKVFSMLIAHNFRCTYCKCDIFNNWTLDRINNNQPHLHDNCVISCLNCNRERSDHYTYQSFKNKKLLDCYSEKHPQIYLISEADKQIFYKIKNNIPGGPSIVFHRFHAAYETMIKRCLYDIVTKSWSVIKYGNTVTRILGYDANALYLYCKTQDMPCGELKYFEVKDYDYFLVYNQIINGELFGFVECDIYVKEDDYNKFGEFCPLFKNEEIPFEQLSDYMKYIYHKINGDKKPHKSKKLISSMFCVKKLIYTPLLIWYIKHGLVINRIYSYIKCIPSKVFLSFTEEVTRRRREGDIDSDKEAIGNSAKNIGNSSYGKMIENKINHKSICYETDLSKVYRSINKNNFIDLQEIIDNNDNKFFEINKSKTVINQDMPVHVGCAILQLAKLRMLEFYYDCVDKYIGRENFQLMEMDTDSLYMAVGNMILHDEKLCMVINKTLENISEPIKNKIDRLKNFNEYFDLTFDDKTHSLFSFMEPLRSFYKLNIDDQKEKINILEDILRITQSVRFTPNEILSNEQINILNPNLLFESLVKPEMIEEFRKDKNNWFPRYDVMDYFDRNSKSDPLKNFKHDSRTPGLFKLEFYGHRMISLAPKTYIVQNDNKSTKISSKGISKKNNKDILIFDKYKEVLFDENTLPGQNIGFRMNDNIMHTYESNKIGLSPYYDKRGVMDDKVTTYPLMI